MLTAKPLDIFDLPTEWKPLGWFKPDERELARHDDQQEIRRRGEDMLANGQLQAVGATEDGRMIYGHGRHLSAEAVGIKTLQVKIYPASLPDTQFRLIRAAENLQRKDLTSHRKWLLCADLMRGNPTWQMKDLADHLHLDPSMVTRLLSPGKCIPAVQEALADGKLGISDCYAISKLPEPEQAGMLARKLSGASRDAIEQAGRKTRNVGKQAVRVARIKCPMSRAVVQISGADISLDEAIEAAQEWVKEAKKASEQGLCAKTFERLCRDKAKKEKRP